MATIKNLCAIFILLGVVFATGCQSQCGGCRTPWWRPFARTTTLAPPATHSLGSASGTYYNPSATAANPQGLPYTAPQPGAPNNGWYPSGNAPANTNPPNVNGNFGINTQPGTNFQAGMTQPNTNFQSVTATAFPGGSTQVVSPDFYTTRVDERRDPTRMPVADASAARAPASLQSFGTFRAANQRFNQNFGTFTQNPGLGTPQGFAPNPGPVVLSRATTAPDANPNFQNGWRPNGTGGQPSITR